MHTDAEERGAYPRDFTNTSCRNAPLTSLLGFDGGFLHQPAPVRSYKAYLAFLVLLTFA